MRDEDVERLVQEIADRVRARLDVGVLAGAMPVALRDIPCDDEGAPGNDCASCGLCVVRRPWSVRAIEEAGASRVAAPAGVGQLPADMASLIDHTLLKPDVTRDDVRKLCDEARRYRFASVCVNSTWVPVCKALLAGSGVMVCAVVGFPLGAMSPTAKAYEARDAVRAGASEIDMVVNIGALKSRDYETVFEDICRVVKAAHPAKVKVILETGGLNQEEKIVGCTLSKLAGAHFVKTSTGFGPGGATVEDIALMRKIVGREMGVKASGGVRTREDAEKMALAGANRIGASASVAIVTGEKTKADDGKKKAVGAY
jgi:deoxyribose-phosphate aldolase